MKGQQELLGVTYAAKIDKVEIRWPDGSLQSFEGVVVDKFYRVKQGGMLTPVRY